MKNKLIDLNDHLFAQLEKLGDDECNLETEIARTKGITAVAHAIIDNARLALDAKKLIDEGMIKATPEMIGDTKRISQ